MAVSWKKNTQKTKQNKNPETQGGPVSNVF